MTNKTPPPCDSCPYYAADYQYCGADSCDAPMYALISTKSPSDPRLKVETDILGTSEDPEILWQAAMAAATSLPKIAEVLVMEDIATIEISEPGDTGVIVMEVARINSLTVIDTVDGVRA